MAKFLVEILINAAGEPQARAVFDSVGASASSFSKDVEAASLRSETALRKVTDAATKLQDQMADTTKSKGFVTDMTALNAKLSDQITAWKQGAEGIASWTQRTNDAAQAQQILTAQVKAGVSAQSDAGQQIASQITLYNKLQSDLAKAKGGLHGGGAAGSSGLLQSLLGQIGGVGGEGGQIVAEFAAKITDLGEKFDGLVDKCGGVGKAISVMTGSFVELLPILVEVAVAAVAVGAVWAGFEFLKDAIKEGMAFQETITQLDNILRQNGTTTKMSAREMQEYADSLVVVTGRDEDVILKTEMVLARFDKLGKDGFERATKLALDYAQANKKDVVESGELVGKMLEGGTKGMQALASVGDVLTKSQKATLTQMVDTGNIAGYQAIVFKLLEDKVGDAAAAFSGTLAGSIAIAGTVMGEFRKGIASEVIPALEDMTTTVVGGAGGWAALRGVALIAGHEVGDAVREMDFTAGVAFLDWEAQTELFKAGFLTIIKVVVDDSLGLIGKFVEGVGKIPGVGAPFKEAADGIARVRDAVAGYLDGEIADVRKAATDEASSLAALVIKYNEHRQALLADDQAHTKVGASTDIVGKKFKDLESILASVKQTLQGYADKIDDITTKQQHQIGEQQYLSDALDGGLLAYKQAEVEQQRSSAITTALTQVYKDHRAEIEKLTQDRNKLTLAGQSAAASGVQATIDAENKSYSDQAAGLGILAGKIFDTTEANKLKLKSDQDTLTLENQLALDQAKLTDLTTRNSDATRTVTADQAREKDILSLLSPEMRSHLDDLRFLISLNKDATVYQSALNAALDNTTNVRASVADWEQQREATLAYGTEITTILKQYGLLDDATQQRAIDEKVLAALNGGMATADADNLRKQLEGQQQVVNGLHLMQAQIEINEKVYKDFADTLSQNLATVFGNFVKDTQVSLNDFRDAVVSTFSSILQKSIQDWLTQWFEAMAQWLARWSATQAVAKAVQAGSSSGGGADGAGTSYGDMAASMAGQAATTYGTSAASGVGGASGLLSGSGSLGAAGAVSGWIAVLAVFGLLVNSLNAHMQKTEEDVVQFSSSLNVDAIQSIGPHLDGLVAEGKVVAAQIQSFIISYGGVFESLDSSIAVKRRGQGSNTQWKVYVDGVVTNFGNDMQAALDDATIQAVKHSTTAGMDPLVVAAIKDYVGTSLTDFNNQVAFAQRIATQNMPGIAGQASAASVQYFSDLHQAQVQFAGDLPALNAAIQSIVKKFEDTVQGIENSALGINTATSDFLAGIVAFQSQVSSTSSITASTIQQMIDNTNAQIQTMLRNGPGGGNRGSGGGGGPVGSNTTDGGGADAGDGGVTGGGGPPDASSFDPQWNAQLAALQQAVKEYQDELAKIPKALSDTEVNMAVFDSLYTYLQGSAKYAAQAAEYAKMKVDIEFATIKLQLIALGKWEQFSGMWQDALTAAEKGAINQARSKPGGSTSTGTSLVDLRAQIASMQAEAAGAVQKSYYDLTVSIADFAKNAKAAKMPAAELATAIDLMTKKFQADLLTQAQGFAGIGTDFTNQLSGVTTFFKELEDLGRNTTGIPNWLEKLMKGDALDKLGATLTDSIDQFNGLVDPMVSINSQADTLRQNVVAYGKATGETADQIQAALDKINAGVGYQKEVAVNGIMDTLFGYLKSDSKYAQQTADLKKKEVDLQFMLIEAQLKALDAWDAATQQVFADAQKAAEDATAGVVQAAMSDYAANVIQDRNTFNAAGDAAVQSWRAAVQSFTQQTQAVITNPALTGLTQQQQYQASLQNFNNLLTQAQGGSSSALSQLDAARQDALTQAHAEFGGGQGFQQIYQQIMGESADLLANAQQTEAQVFADAMANQTTTQTTALTTAIYTAASQVAAAVRAGFAGIPHYAEGGIALRPHIALVGEKGPEAIVPLSRPVVYPTPGGSARILSFQQGGGGNSTPLPGVIGGGMTGGGDLADAVAKLAQAQARMAGDIRSIAVSTAQTAKSNDGLQKTDRIRRMIGKRR